MMATEGSSEDNEATSDGAEGDLLRTTERERLRSLVEGNMGVARQLHSIDFQLVTPDGNTLSIESYLGSIAAGRLKYISWIPGSIGVRLHGHMAVIRYQSEIEIMSGGLRVPLRRYWHTDSYEKSDGRWQIVWAQATEIR